MLAAAAAAALPPATSIAAQKLASGPDRVEAEPCGWPKYIQEPYLLWISRKTKEPSRVHLRAVGERCCKKIRGTSIWSGGTFNGVRPAGNATHNNSLERDEFSWIKLISHHTKRGEGREVLRIYNKLREKGVTPEIHTFLAALKASGSMPDLKTGTEIHANLKESWRRSDIFLANTLLRMYVKCGNMVNAQHVFERMARHDVVSWNTLIMGYAQGDAGESALQFYGRMQHEGFKPNHRTFVAALKACGSMAREEEGKEVDGELVKMECLEKGRGIHSQIANRGFESNVFVASTLVDMYAKCGSMVDACQVFEKMTYRNVVSWNAMITGYAQKDSGQLALQLYARMQHEGFTPNHRTFVAVLKACSTLAAQEEGKRIGGELIKVQCLDKGRAIHSQVAKYRLESNMFVASTLVDMYAKCGSMVDACRVFERMPHRDVVSWTAMIMGYAEMKKGNLALQLYGRMQQEGVAPNHCTFVAALKGCCTLAKQQDGKQVDDELLNIGCLERGRAIHSQIAKSGFHSNMLVANTLVDMYSKCGSIVDARWVFESMPHRDLVSWSTMIMAYAQTEEGESALQLYTQMQHEGFTPNAHTFAAVLMACGSLASLETGKKIHADICIAGLDHDAFIIASLVDMYAKCGNMDDAQQLFDALPTRDVVQWSALIAGYSNQGDSERVFSLFERMQQEGIQPVGITFLSVLTVCSHAGLVEKGQKHFQVMCTDYGITPASDHYNCMIDLLGRAGQLDVAVALVKNMPFKPGIITWMTILGACRKWNNVEVGRHAFECVVMLDGKQAAAYVLMTNIYASACMWEENAKIQARRMKV